MSFASAEKYYLIINSNKEFDLFNDNFNSRLFEV